MPLIRLQTIYLMLLCWSDGKVESAINKFDSKRTNRLCLSRSFNHSNNRHRSSSSPSSTLSKSLSTSFLKGIDNDKAIQLEPLDDRTCDLIASVPNQEWKHKDTPRALLTKLFTQVFRWRDSCGQINDDSDDDDRSESEEEYEDEEPARDITDLEFEGQANGGVSSKNGSRNTTKSLASSSTQSSQEAMEASSNLITDELSSDTNPLTTLRSIFEDKDQDKADDDNQDGRGTSLFDSDPKEALSCSDSKLSSHQQHGNIPLMTTPRSRSTSIVSFIEIGEEDQAQQSEAITKDILILQVTSLGDDEQKGEVHMRTFLNRGHQPGRKSGGRKFRLEQHRERLNLCSTLKTQLKKLLYTTFVPAIDYCTTISRSDLGGDQQAAIVVNSQALQAFRHAKRIVSKLNSTIQPPTSTVKPSKNSSDEEISYERFLSSLSSASDSPLDSKSVISTTVPTPCTPEEVSIFFVATLFAERALLLGLEYAMIPDRNLLASLNKVFLYSHTTNFSLDWRTRTNMIYKQAVKEYGREILGFEKARRKQLEAYLASYEMVQASKKMVIDRLLKLDNEY